MAVSRQPFSRPPCDLATTTKCEMAVSEIGVGTIAKCIDTLFTVLERQWGEGGSPWRQFYEKAASMPGKRVVVWNKDR